MNPQYIQQQQSQQQQQQSQQQPSYFSGPPTSSPYGEVNSNVPSNMLKRPPMNSQLYASQKTMQGPSLTNLHQPQAPYYVNNIQTQGNMIYSYSSLLEYIYFYNKITFV